MPTIYPTELKVKTIRRYERGESIKALSEELHISQSTLYQWRKEHCTIKTSTRTYTPAEFDTVCRRLQKLEHQLEIIYRSGFLSHVPLQKNSPLLRTFIISLTIHTAFMSCVTLLVLQEEPSTITFSVGRITVNTKKNKLSSC